MRVALALLLLGATSCLHAADLALVGGTVYPSPDAEPISNSVVLINGKTIVAVGARGSVAVPRDAKVVDCSGKFITAGFWNSHVHIFTPGLLHVRDKTAAQLDEQLTAMLNRWGFTTVFDIGSVLDNTLALRRRIDSGEVRGPRILTAGYPLLTEIPVYVRDYLITNRIQMPIVSTPAEAVALVRKDIEGGANGIKLFTGSLQAGGKVANMPLKMAKAAVQEAHRHKLPVFTHPQNSAGVEIAIESGVDILAHTVPGSPPWTPEFVARLKRAHMALIPTLTLFDSEARKDGASDSTREEFVNRMVAELRAFVRNGGEVLFGTDVGYIQHFDTAMEYTLMSQAGMNFRQILASLTINPAQRFGYSVHSGKIARDMDADINVMQDDFAKDITALARIQLTIHNGQIIYSAN